MATTNITPLVLNTKTRCQRQCTACGDYGPSWCAEYPETQRALQWVRQHNAAHKNVRTQSLQAVNQPAMR